MSEFELKLRIQSLEDRLAYLAGGTDGDELAGIIIEKDEELRRCARTLQQYSAQIKQLSESGKQLDCKRREALSACEAVRGENASLASSLQAQTGACEALRGEQSRLLEALAASSTECQRLHSSLAALQV